jgi:hypothetical protein
MTAASGIAKIKRHERPPCLLAKALKLCHWVVPWLATRSIHSFITPDLMYVLGRVWSRGRRCFGGFESCLQFLEGLYPIRPRSEAGDFLFQIFLLCSMEFSCVCWCAGGNRNEIHDILHAFCPFWPRWPVRHMSKRVQMKDRHGGWQIRENERWYRQAGQRARGNRARQWMKYCRLARGATLERRRDVSSSCSIVLCSNSESVENPSTMAYRVSQPSF